MPELKMPHDFFIRAAIFLTSWAICVHGSKSVAPLDSVGSPVHARSDVGPPLFGYETVQLTPEAIQRLHYNEQTANFAHLFHFEDGTQVNPDLPKRSGECKAYPGDKWPSVGAWGTLSDQLLELGGNLIPTTPIAGPCYSNWGPYNSTKCDAVIKGFADPYFQ